MDEDDREFKVLECAYMKYLLKTARKINGDYFDIHHAIILRLNEMIAKDELNINQLGATKP